MYTYLQRPVCKKENTATYVHTGRVSNAYSRIRTARARVHGWVRTEKQRRHRVHGEATECVVFMGRQRNASCSWGGNGMRRVHREGLDGTCDGNEAWRTAKRRKRPCVRPAMFETGSCSSGGVWHTAKQRKRTSYGRNGGPVDREGCGVPQNVGNRLVLERYGRNGGHVHQEGCGVPQNRTPRDTVHLHRRLPPRATIHPPLTSSSLHLRLFIHGLLFIQPPPRATPPATIQPALSTGSCSTTPAWTTVHPALHRLLFNQMSTGSPCSSSPPWGCYVLSLRWFSLKRKG